MQIQISWLLQKPTDLDLHFAKAGFIRVQQHKGYILGVLNCSEAAIRHARVVQEWGTSVQLMFEEMKDERMRMQVKHNY